MKKERVITPDPLSLCTHQLRIKYSVTDLLLATGTAFDYKLEDKIYLVTNWHNISGINPFTKERISDHAGIANIFSTTFRGKENAAISFKVDINLYKDEEMKFPNWYVHPTYGENIDVVAIEIPEKIFEKFETFPLNEKPFDFDIPPIVSDSVFIIGYPFEQSEHLEFPIWKKGSIATEPELNRDNVPKLLIDTATRPGFSGAPVIVERIGVHKQKDGKPTPESFFGRMRNFLGVYSGRIGQDEFQAQLGIVWKAHVIDEIITAKKFGTTEFHHK